MEPAIGKTVVPSELKAWANVSRLWEVEDGPSREMSGFETTWTSTTPLASTKRAKRNSS